MAGTDDAPMSVRDALARARGELRSATRAARLSAYFAWFLLSLVAVRGTVGVWVGDEPLATPVGTALGIGIVVALAGALVSHRQGRARDRLVHDVAMLEVAELVAAHDDAEGSLRAKVAADEKAPATEPEESMGSGTRALASGLVLACVALLVFFVASAPTSRLVRWRFLDVASDTSSLGLTTTRAGGGTWAVEHHPEATGARALVNRIGEPGAGPAILVAREASARDLRAATRCKVNAEAEAEAACGLVFGYRDEANYGLARLDVARRKLVIATIRGGVERELASAEADVAKGVWHELVAEVHGGNVRASCDGRFVVEARGAASSIGKAGVWVPASTEAFFDELALDLHPTNEALDIVPILSSRSE